MGCSVRPPAGNLLRLVRCTQPRSVLAAGNGVTARAVLRGLPRLWLAGVVRLVVAICRL